MIPAKELYEAGHLAEAIAQLTQEVRAYPTDADRRIFLFELLCFAGDFQRAARQLDVVGHQEASLALGVQGFRNLLVAEEARRQVLTDELQPHFLYEPPPYVALHLEALQQLRADRPEAARALLEESERLRPPVQARLDGKTWGNFRDADDLLAPCLEVIVGPHYVWLPFVQIQCLHIAPPKTLRDLLWASARIDSQQGLVEEVVIPVLYVDSHTHADERVRLGRMTDWQSVGAGLMRGMGQHVFLAGDEDAALLDVRVIEFETGASNTAVEGRT